MKKYTVHASIFNLVMRLQSAMGKRLSNAELSRMSGISVPTVWRLMNGTDATPDKRTLEALLGLFNNNGVEATPNDFYIITVEGDEEPVFRGRPGMTDAEYQDYLVQVEGYLAEPLPVPEEPLALESQPPMKEHPRRSRLIKRDQRDRYQKRKESLATRESSQPVPDAV